MGTNGGFSTSSHLPMSASVDSAFGVLTGKFERFSYSTSDL